MHRKTELLAVALVCDTCTLICHSWHWADTHPYSMKKRIKNKSPLKPKMMFWKTLDLFWCQRYVRFESIFSFVWCNYSEKNRIEWCTVISSGTFHRCPVLHPSQAETAVYYHPNVQGSSESPSVNSLGGSKIEPLCQAASGAFIPTPSSLPPLFGCFCNVLSLFCKTPLIVRKWFLQPPFGNKWPLICVLSILNLSLRCFCCWRFLNEKEPSHGTYCYNVFFIYCY